MGEIKMKDYRVKDLAKTYEDADTFAFSLPYRDRYLSSRDTKRAEKDTREEFARQDQSSYDYLVSIEKMKLIPLEALRQGVEEDCLPTLSKEDFFDGEFPNLAALKAGEDVFRQKAKAIKKGCYGEVRESAYLWYFYNDYILSYSMLKSLEAKKEKGEKVDPYSYLKGELAPLKEHLLDYKISPCHTGTFGSLMITFYVAMDDFAKEWLSHYDDLFGRLPFEDLCFYKNFHCLFSSITHEKMAGGDRD